MIVRNASANAAGMAAVILTQAVMMIAAYRLAGPEPYGLIGFFGTLLTAAAILDVGLGQTVVRETARRRGVAKGAADTRGAALYTFQVLYGGIVCLVIATIVAAAPLIARVWLKPSHIPAADVRTAVMLMGVAIGVQRLRLVYQSTLDGLERQALTNALLAATSLLRLLLGLGALLMAPTATAYFCGQIVASVIETAFFAATAWRAIPAASPCRFDPSILREVAGFAWTNGAGAALGTLIQIADALVISAVMPLAVFGSYAFVSQVCLAMLRLATPLLNAVLPRMSLYVREGRRDALARLFFAHSQALAALFAASAGVLIGFGGAMLLALTGKPAVAHGFAPVLALLAAAYAVNGLSRGPHGLQLAEGAPMTALQINLVQAATYFPLIAILTPRFGVILPAGLLLIANVLAFVVFTRQAFARSLRGLRRAWLVQSVIPPLIAAGAVCGLVRLATPSSAPLWVQLSAAVSAGGAALSAAVLAGAPLRRVVSNVLAARSAPTGKLGAVSHAMLEPRGRP